MFKTTFVFLFAQFTFLTSIGTAFDNFFADFSFFEKKQEKTVVA
jgi:hypothetical protein